MKALGLILISIGCFMYFGLIAAIAGHMPSARQPDLVSFLSPLLPIALGVLALRKARTSKVKKDGFSL